MSSLAFLLLLLLFCLSLHACPPGPLTLTQKQSAKCPFYKDLDKVLILETIITASKPGPCTLEGKKVRQRKVAHDETIICERGGSASTLKEVVTGPSSRHAGATTSFPTDSPSLLPGQRRHTRSMLGPAQHHVEETVNPNAGDTRVDMVEMDYAQPHRKPPIHNEKP